MTVTDWVAIVLGAIIIVGIVAIAILKSGRHKRHALMAEQRSAELREEALRHLSPDDRERFEHEWRLIDAGFIEGAHHVIAQGPRDKRQQDSEDREHEPVPARRNG